MSVSVRRRHRAVASLLFVVLGLQVGGWSVAVGALAVALRLSAGALGVALSAGAAGGIVTLLLGGAVADRIGRRPVLLIGLVGTGLAFALLATADGLAHVVVGVLAYGLTVSFIDLGANLVGTDFEHEHDARALTGLQAGFPAGAVVGALGAGLALAAGADFRGVLLGLAAVFTLAAAAAARVDLPRPSAREPEGRGGVAVLRVAGVGFAALVLVVCFFGDGALEGFLAVYLRRTLHSGAFLSGIAVAGYHGASFVGRLLADRLLQRRRTGHVIVCAGVLATVGIGTALAAPSTAVAIIGLLVTGFAISPVVPSALSHAARSAPGRSGAAVSTVTAVGYSSFLLSPLAVGALASATDLRVGLAVVVLTSLGVAALGARWPRR